jgi:hypothetical protein
MGYNYYDGTSWGAGPSVRLETVRTGFGNIAVTGAGREMTIAHEGGTSSLYSVSRTTKGTGTWNPNASLYSYPANHPGTLWPVSAVGGMNNDVIHVVALSIPTASGGGSWAGQEGAIQYSRSNDGGQTFAVQNQLIAAFDSTQEVGYGGDAYAIDARGDYVAIAAGGPGRDVVLAKSTDGGLTWIKTVIQDFPIPLYNSSLLTDSDGDGIIDTLATNDGSLAVLIDNNNQVHVWFGNMRIVDDDVTDDVYSYFPGTNGLRYWNESMGADGSVVITGALDLDGNGSLDLPVAGDGSALIGTYQVSLSSFPTAAIDGTGTIYLAYSAIVENSADNASGKAVRNVYITASTDGGDSWTDPYNVAPSTTDEKVYPCIARAVVNGNLNLIYQKDLVAGHGVGVTNPPDQENATSVNDIIHLLIPSTDVFVGLNESVNPVGTITAYPNPAKDFLNVIVDITTAQKVKISLVNTLGQTVLSQNNNLTTGSTSIQLNIENLTPGIYFLDVTSESSRSVQKIVIE